MVIGNKQLKFIHITKTGGTSVEESGLAAGYEWGRFHADYGWWHTLFPLLPQRMKERYDWFTIVRNPLSRMASEFHCQWGGVGDTDLTKYTRESFNAFVRRKIRRHSHGGAGNHYSAQILYMDPDIPIRVLHFENLTQGFNALMEEYGYNVSLTHVNHMPRAFTEADFETSTVDLIHKTYAADFTQFGYI